MHLKSTRSRLRSTVGITISASARAGRGRSKCPAEMLAILGSFLLKDAYAAVRPCRPDSANWALAGVDHCPGPSPYDKPRQARQRACQLAMATAVCSPAKFFNQSGHRICGDFALLLSKLAIKVRMIERI